MKFRLARERHELLDAWPIVLPHVGNVVVRHSDYTADDLRDMLAWGALRLVLMESDEGTFLGFGIVQARPFPAKKYLHDAHVWVLPEHRSNGVYGAYLQFLRELAEAEGCAGVTLAVHADEDTDLWRGILQRRGFRPRAVEYVAEV